MIQTVSVLNTITDADADADQELSPEEGRFSPPSRAATSASTSPGHDHNEDVGHDHGGDHDDEDGHNYHDHDNNQTTH